MDSLDLSRRGYVATVAGLSIGSLSGCLRFSQGGAQGGGTNPDIRGHINSIHPIESAIYLGTNTAFYRIPRDGNPTPEELSNRPIGSIVETENGVFLTDFSKVLRWEDGESAWSTQFTPIKTDLQYADGLVVGTAQNLIRLSDAVEPTVEWQTPISNIKRILGTTDEIIVVKTQDEIRGFAIDSGEEVIEPIPNDGLVAASIDNLIVSENTLYQIESSATVTELSTISAPRFVNQPVVGDDALYAAGGNREIARIGSSSQEIEWETSIAEDADVLAVDDQMVYAGLDTIEDVSGPTVVGIDATSGEIRWDTELSGESMRSLQSVGGVVIAEVLVNETESLQEYTITALEPDSGTENWSLGASYELG